MRFCDERLWAGLVLSALVATTSGAVAQEAAQAAATTQTAPQAQTGTAVQAVPVQTVPVPAATVQADPATASADTPSVPASPSVPAAPTKKTYLVPAGTKVLLQLRSSLNTRSAQAGDGVYLASTFPVVVGNRVLIPTGVYVQGIVDRVQRAGRVKGKAELDMHFTSIIFPNGSVVDVPGLVNSVPGSHNQQVKNDGEGTIQQDGNKGRNAGRAAEIALPTGAGVGELGGALSGHPIGGGIVGIAAGLAAVGIVTLFTRGADVNIEAGTQVEMVLQRPLILEDANLGEQAGGPGAAPQYVPVANQPKPMDKPKRPRVICPPGGLGCDQ